MDEITRRILDNFAQINAIPRCSKKEERILHWLEQWAAENHFGVDKDNSGNLCIRVPASAGKESGPTIILQGHVDMVCEKTKDSTHDFSKDPIPLVFDGDWVKADGTTLGADNGIALAIAMTLAAERTISHPPLELLFTVDEESGLIGAKNLDPELISGKILLNLDSETEGVFTVGCAGGQDTRIRLDVEFEELPDGFSSYALGIHGLRGGHSGIDIHKHRANANKLLARAVNGICRTTDCRISSIKGGTVHNAIARDAGATVSFDAIRFPDIEKMLRHLETSLQKEYAGLEPDLSVSIAATGKVESALSRKDSLTAVRLLQALPHGVDRMSPFIDNLVETSSNLATIEMVGGQLKILSSQRSSAATRLEEVTARIEGIAALAGAASTMENSYPPWEPNLDSPLLNRCSSVYRELFGSDPEVQTIHAGLECGIIGSKKPELDMISVGPSMEQPHSPGERLYVPSIQYGGFWSPCSIPIRTPRNAGSRFIMNHDSESISPACRIETQIPPWRSAGSSKIFNTTDISRLQAAETQRPRKDIAVRSARTGVRSVPPVCALLPAEKNRKKPLTGLPASNTRQNKSYLSYKEGQPCD